VGQRRGWERGVEKLDNNRVGAQVRTTSSSKIDSFSQKAGSKSSEPWSLVQAVEGVRVLLELESDGVREYERFERSSNGS
jgi:hypothetical protein